MEERAGEVGGAAQRHRLLAFVSVQGNHGRNATPAVWITAVVCCLT